MTMLTSETREQLKAIGTATLTSCLFKRGLRNQFIQDVRPLNPNAGTMVGEAFTLRYMPAREDLNPMTVFQNPDHPQRQAVEQSDGGRVQCRGPLQLVRLGVGRQLQDPDLGCAGGGGGSSST